MDKQERSQKSPSHPGITTRHSPSCPSRSGGKCGKPCKPAFQAHVWDARSKQRVRKTFASVSEAKQWRRDFSSALARGTVRPPTRQTLDAAAAAWLTGAKDGTIRTRSGDPFKPSTLREYERALSSRILPGLGHLRLSDVSRAHLQDVADKMLSQGADASTIRNAFMGTRRIFWRAVARGEVSVNPTSGLELPAVRGRRDRISPADEALRLLEALEASDRPLWATALFAGLRRGELQGLKWADVDLDANLIHVRRAWDQLEGEIQPKSHAGTRKIPIVAVLRRYLVEHKLAASDLDGYVFASSTGKPFDPGVKTRRADRRWKAAGLDRLTLHECRHTAASYWIAAGLNAKTVSTFLGHSSISITFDRYGGLFPGAEDEAAGLIDGYLERSIEALA